MVRNVALMLTVLLLPAAPARAAQWVATYEGCLALAKTKPDQAFDQAMTWRAMGGGFAADHCTAMALLELGIFDEAAFRLEKLAEGGAVTDVKTRARLFGQAGNAWLDDGKTDRAHAAFTAAVRLDPAVPDLWIDRARCLAAIGRYADAISDLDQALTLDAKRPEIWVYRATAWRYQADFAKAQADLVRALALKSDHVDALLERGILRRLQGDSAGARQDWLKVRLLDPNGPSGANALSNIEKLDLGRE